MEWSNEARSLKTHVNGKIPIFVRKFVDRVITKVAEEHAARNPARMVTVDSVVRAYLDSTPKAMNGLMVRALQEYGVNPETFGYTGEEEGAGFTIGEPMSPEEIEQFLAVTVTGRLGTSAGNRPYVVPLSFVYLDGAIYYHWFSYEGRKIDTIRENPRVCFEADEYTRDHLNYRSVIADGSIIRVEEKAEKAKVLQALACKFPEYATGAGHNAEIQGIITKGFDAMTESVEIYRIDIEAMTGKKKGTMS
jgi:nitroimidazol reductase NimA-like FMN-containing flavoprotein (pyridoxamine 5'-phosphate oxidase superfamily)